MSGSKRSVLEQTQTAAACNIGLVSKGAATATACSAAVDPLDAAQMPSWQNVSYATGSRFGENAARDVAFLVTTMINIMYSIDSCHQGFQPGDEPNNS